MMPPSSSLARRTGERMVEQHPEHAGGPPPSVELHPPASLLTRGWILAGVVLAFAAAGEFAGAYSRSLHLAVSVPLLLIALAIPVNRLLWYRQMDLAIRGWPRTQVKVQRVERWAVGYGHADKFEVAPEGQSWRDIVVWRIMGAERNVPEAGDQMTVVGHPRSRRPILFILTDGSVIWPRARPKVKLPNQNVTAPGHWFDDRP
jgi:hypothetical protein